jgi:aryl sulfotransferase
LEHRNSQGALILRPIARAPEGVFSRNVLEDDSLSGSRRRGGLVVARIQEGYCPKKTRELVDWMMDSTVWNEFKYRKDDIVIATYAKAGTTWVQQIVAQLIFGGDDVPVGELSLWVEHRLVSKEATLALLERQTHRRFLKTHLPVDALVFLPGAKYIYVARDGRDVLWSYHKFRLGFGPPSPEDIKVATANGISIPPAPNPDIRQFYHDWLDKDGYPSQPFFEHIQSWWNIRDLPNVMLLHFNNLKEHMPAEIQRIAKFLDINVDTVAWTKVLEHCTFDYMKRNAEVVAPGPAANLQGGKTAFFNQGANERWRDVLTPAEAKKYEDLAARKLTPDCARWLKTGELRP